MKYFDRFGQSDTPAQSNENAPIRLPVIDEFEACHDLETYWESLRDGNLVPGRMQFDPRVIERALSNTFVAERVARNVVRIRVAGTELNTLLGMDVRGMPITAFFDPAAREDISRGLQAMFDTPCKTILDLSSPARLGRRAIRARLILLPMRDIQGEINRVVGCLETIGGATTSPRRFNVDRVKTEELFAASGDGILRPSRSDVKRPVRPAVSRPNAPKTKPEFAFSDRSQADYTTRQEARADAITKIAAHPNHGHLRLVVDNG